jgi:peptidyl-prolyl cis-trans isomerase D
MLQNLRESTGRWVAAGILGLIAITFIFFGIDFSVTGATFAAKVNGDDIPILEFERDYQQAQNQYQQLYPIELTDDMRRQLRSSVVERMVLAKALEQRADEAGYRVSDERLSDSIRSTPAFQVGGEFSPDVYSARLNAEGLTPGGYETLHRRQLELLDLEDGIERSTFFTPTEFRRYIELFNERRELGFALFDVDDFLAAVEVSAEQVGAHYAANSAQYMSAETVDLEYVELDQGTLAAGVVVTDEALEAYYNEQPDRFQTAEERHARHILVAVENDDRAAAEAEAAAVLARVQGGEDFAAVAMEVSDDTGTKALGGDLGWIARGLLTGAFEDALFAMQVGEVKGPVETDFGFHIIRLEEIRASRVQTFADVRDEIAAEYQVREAEDLFYDQANRLEELAFDAYDELASVATQMNLPVKTLAGYPRGGDPNAFANNAPVVQAAFDEELVSSGNNSRLIELADDRVMVLRVTAHNPPAPLPLESVSEQIRAQLARAAAQERVAAAAAAFLDELVNEPVATGADPAGAAPSRDLGALAATHAGTWNAPRWVERSDANVPTELLGVAFGVAAPLPEGGVRQVVPMASGDAAVMVLAGIQSGDPDLVPLTQRDEQQQRLAQEAAGSEMNSYARDVRERATVRVPDEVLNPQQ